MKIIRDEPSDQFPMLDRVLDLWTRLVVFIGLSIAAVLGSVPIITLPANIVALLATQRAIANRLPREDIVSLYFRTFKSAFGRSLMVVWPLSLALILSWLNLRLIQHHIPPVVLGIDRTAIILIDVALGVLVATILAQLSINPSSLRRAVHDARLYVQRRPGQAALFLLVLITSLALCQLISVLYFVMLGGVLIGAANRFLIPK